MPWYVTLVLFALSPLYATWFRDHFWTQFRDWWAARSIRSLRRRIAELEELLAQQPVTALEVSIYCWRRFFRCVIYGGFAGLPFFAVIFEPFFDEMFWVTNLHKRIPLATNVPVGPTNMHIIGMNIVLLATLFLWSRMVSTAIASIRELKKVSTPAGRELYKNNIEKRLSTLKSQLPDGV